MPYKRYGEIFKKLREQKNFSLSHFSEIGISKASLSRFELGQTMISFERLDSALQEMNVLSMNILSIIFQWIIKKNF